jgi:chloride channel protein, CIC family
LRESEAAAPDLMATLVQNWRRAARNDQLMLFVLALVIGTAAGYGALLFRILTGAIQTLLFGHASERVAEKASLLPWWQVMLAPTMGGLAIGLCVYFLLPGRRPHAVADVIEASALRGGRMSLRVGCGAALVSAASIGCGASVGREGPIVHFGATLGSFVAQRLHLSASLGRTLLGCGIAAAIASAFNAPIAGFFFALEVVIGHYRLSAVSPLVISAVIGTVITRVHIGPEAAFVLEPQVVVSFWELPAFALLGVVSALAAILLVRAIAAVQAAHQRLGVPVWLQPALAGVVVGAIAIRLPEVLGVGYDTTDLALRNAFSLQLVILLALAKGAATALCLGSSFGGGIFSPSLVVGALLGSAFGMIADDVVPALGSSPSVYALLGMGAVAACTLGAPISTVLIIFELTTEYHITFAVMVAVAIATLLTRLLHRPSFFIWQLAARGIDLTAGRELALLRAGRLEEVMRREVATVGPDATLEDLKGLFRQRHLPIFVVDEGGRLFGSIAFEDLADAAFEAGPAPTATAGDLVRRIPEGLVPEDDLETALRLCETRQEEHLPVVDNRRDLKVIGEVRYQDLVLAYNRALLAARAAERGDD